eukprot:GHRR01031468.1.p1 GENE.GHRR01031468.1~~GHRR01031468.1.p1  ORF type:complete len:508 (+),score=226.57 GHRR01031468.1:2668-4191(+)
MHTYGTGACWCAGTSLLPSATGHAEAALESPHRRLRRLGVQQLGRLLLLSQDQHQQHHVQSTLLRALQDADTGLAGEAEKALVLYFAAHPAAFQVLLSPDSTVGQQLQSMLDGSRGDATQRMRVFSVVMAAAATHNSNAELFRQSGFMQQLLNQLSPCDPLTCLVALQLLQELVTNLGPSAAQLMEQLLLPALLPLLDDAGTVAGALPIAARLVAEAATAGAAYGGGSSVANMDGQSQHTRHVQSNGNGVVHDSPANALLVKMAEALDDRGNAGPEQEIAVLDAAGQLAQPSSSAAALLAMVSDTLLPAICNRAVGRTASPEVRLAALHALASIAGVERAGEARDRSASLLPAAAEDALRRSVYRAVSGAAGGVGGARSPAEAVNNLLQQPFADVRTGVYRCFSALALRTWLAVDVCNNSTLLQRLCDAHSESGQQACEWRHSSVMALWATVQYIISLPNDAAEARYKQQLPAAVQQQLLAAARAGPYGVGAHASQQQSHFVATVPR